MPVNRFIENALRRGALIHEYEWVQHDKPSLGRKAGENELRVTLDLKHILKTSKFDQIKREFDELWKKQGIASAGHNLATCKNGIVTFSVMAKRENSRVIDIPYLYLQEYYPRKEK